MVWITYDEADALVSECYELFGHRGAALPIVGVEAAVFIGELLDRPRHPRPDGGFHCRYIIDHPRNGLYRDAGLRRDIDDGCVRHSACDGVRLHAGLQ